MQLQIVTSDNDNFLLGIDWIKQHEANLLFRSDELEILDNGRPVRVKMTTEPAHVIHVIEKPKAEVNMTWNMDEFLNDVNQEREDSPLSTTENGLRNRGKTTSSLRPKS